MLSLEKCNEILNRNCNKYSEEEVKLIRNLLYKIARLDLKNYSKKENEQRNNLHKSINRRAGR